MSLASQLLRQIDNPALGHAERARLRCRHAKELEDSGNYESAREAMGDLWRRVGERPQVEGLDQQTAAEVLLRAGTLSGWIGSANQIEGAQEIAKDLISESAVAFETLHDVEKAAEARIDLAICYWREGAYDEARVTLREVLSRLTDRESEQKARALLNIAVVDLNSSRFNDALHSLAEAAPLFESSRNEAARGRFHVNLALVLKKLGAAEQREDYTDRALVEYAAASYHFEQAGHTYSRAVIANNLSQLLFLKGKFTEAHEHLDRAHLLFTSLKDSVHTARVDDTRARVLLAQRRNAEAEKVSRSAVRTLEKGGEQSVLAESLTTRGVALARLGRYEESRLTLERAMAVAAQAGDNEGAGVAALTIIEELSEQINAEEMANLYERADRLLTNTQNAETLARLRACVRRTFEAGRTQGKGAASPNFIYADNQTAEFLREAHRIAGTQATVLVIGETGTGKELLARMIHEWSGRAGRFVAINCAAVSEDLFESILFGHSKGGFTEAVSASSGIVRQAAGGTLFLDQVAELSPANQGKILRLIEYGEARGGGSPEPQQVDVRIIAAADSNLKERVAQKQFRDDLLYRLNAFSLEIQPLRKRHEDISALAAYFLKEFTEQHNKRVRFRPEAVEALRRLPLRGNVRELRSLVERAVLTAAEGTEITRETVEALGARQTNDDALYDGWAGCSFEEEVLRFESSLIKLALENAGGSVTTASRLLGVTHQRLGSMLQGRHKNLLPAKKPAQTRKRSIITK
ncbi:MAG TPA: sigma 54-interacting transcriptional regulator [Pyrinomonadaceae bacterium]|nr:sigma 54-interacting transcriptional regulator [Pyrinomonadaceae bacterium]